MRRAGAAPERRVAPGSAGVHNRPPRPPWSAMRWMHWVVLLAVMARPAPAQQAQTGLGWSALPALNYDSDQGFGYGVTGGLYQYGDGSRTRSGEHTSEHQS